MNAIKRVEVKLVDEKNSFLTITVDSSAAVTDLLDKMSTEYFVLAAKLGNIAKELIDNGEYALALTHAGDAKRAWEWAVACQSAGDKTEPAPEVTA